MRRKVVYAIATVFCQICEVLGFLHWTGRFEQPVWLQLICVYYFTFAGIILALLRVSEPSVLYTLKKDLAKLFSSCLKKREASTAAKSSF